MARLLPAAGRARIRRLLAACGHPSLKHAASHLGTRASELASQVSQLEAITGGTLLHTGPDGLLALTTHGEQFKRDVMPAFQALSQASGRDLARGNDDVPAAAG